MVKQGGDHSKANNTDKLQRAQSQAAIGNSLNNPPNVVITTFLRSELDVEVAVAFPSYKTFFSARSPRNIAGPDPVELESPRFPAVRDQC